MTISRTFKTLTDAARYCNRYLYPKYDSVQLVKSPIFSEEGVYVWRVK